MAMAKYPRVPCPSCNEPVSGVPTRQMGIVSVKDHKREPRSLVLCPGSMQHVRAADARYTQEMLIEDSVDDGTAEEPITIF